jgi:hypothetical protein
VIAGYGVAANAFGVGAGRKNGRFDRAYPLAAELIASVLELPNGVLALPRMLSDANDAPLLGEAAILWQLTLQPEKGFAVKGGGQIPTYVRVILIGLLVFGVWRGWEAIGNLRQSVWPSSSGPERIVVAPRIQVVIWILVMLIVVVALALGHYFIAVAALGVGSLLPFTRKKKLPTGAEDWPGETPTADQP